MIKKIMMILITFCMISSTNIIMGQSNLKEFQTINQSITNQEDMLLSIIGQIDEGMMLRYIENLVRIAEKHEVSRLTGTDGCEEAREYILNEFMSYGMSVNIHDWAKIGTFFPYNNLLFVSENIEAVMPGHSDSNQTIIIMAHYDTVSNTPSADDNSAGVAAVFTIANVLSQYEFNHEIRFLLVSGEEQGLLGSTAYAENSYQTCESIVNVINLDMIGYSDPEIEDDEYKVRVYETCSNKMTDFVIELCANAEYESYLQFEVYTSENDAGHVSDQRSFCIYGFDSMFIHEYTWNDNKDR